MKLRLISFLFFIALGFNLHAQKNISFHADGPMDGIYLFQNLEDYKLDTLEFKDGTASLKKKVDRLTPFAFARMTPRAYCLIFLEPNSDLRIDLKSTDLTITKVNGSGAQTKYQNFLASQAALQQASQVVQAQYKVPGSNQDSLGNVIAYMNLQLNASFIDFVNENKSSNMASYMIYDITVRNPNIGSEDLKGLYDKLDDKGKATHFGKLINQHLTKLTSLEIGNFAPDFTLKDRAGKSHSLSDLKGKYVLLDFWASWCGPCVQEIPNLKNAYAKYKVKGFEILSVSIDRDINKWQTALDKYQMGWLHVLDTGDENAITQTKYLVPTIPRTVLINKEGMIIGKDYRGASLEQVLEEIFK